MSKEYCDWIYKALKKKQIYDWYIGILYQK